MKRTAGYAVTLLAVAMAASSTQATAATYQTIHQFTGQNSGDGDTPIPELVADSAGRLYGTTQFGGQFGFGSVFRLTPPAKGSKVWTEDILYSFDNGNDEGNDPKGGILIGAAGELYGTTVIGGTNGSGTVYRLDSSGGGWTLTPLHEFPDPSVSGDGSNSIAGLAFGANGLLYGTTSGGGGANGGTAFAIGTTGGSYAILHVFGNGDDGIVPYYGRLAVSKKGQLFGTTNRGGAFDQGTVYSLAAGTWKENVLDNANSPPDVSAYTQDVTLGAGNVVYGCGAGGTHSQGGVYVLTPPAKGSKVWTKTILYNFGDQANDPGVTECAVVQDSSGRLFGTASGGGTFNGGAFFELDPPAKGQTNWTETVLHSFGQTGTNDGRQPVSAPVERKGVFYGVTYAGGTDGIGTAYKLKP
jgi:uncharacterized repeat protein (TIGR03803 family)